MLAKGVERRIEVSEALAAQVQRSTYKGEGGRRGKIWLLAKMVREIHLHP